MNKHLLEHQRTLGQMTSEPNTNEDNTREHYVGPRGQLNSRRGRKPLKKNHQLNSRRRRKPLKKKSTTQLMEREKTLQKYIYINSSHSEGENPSKEEKKKT
jgi:hypothetical protein